MALLPTPSVAQSFCGPVTVVNFNGTNGQYPAAGVMFDSQGTTTVGGIVGLGNHLEVHAGAPDSRAIQLHGLELTFQPWSTGP